MYAGYATPLKPTPKKIHTRKTHTLHAHTHTHTTDSTLSPPNKTTHTRPHFTQKTTFKNGNGKVLMTDPTKFIAKWVLRDLWRTANSNSGENARPLFDLDDLDTCMDQVQTIAFHSTVNIGGIKVTPYYAGHVLGACQYLIEIAGVKILYTGDYSREVDRILPVAEVPRGTTPNILITESTFGINNSQPRLERENRLKGIVRDTVLRGGKCLIPVFSVGRAQELLLILDEFREKRPGLRHIKIYYMSQLAKKCITAFRDYPEVMNEKIQRQFKGGRNPFKFTHIEELKGVNDPKFDDSGPSIVLAAPGMLQSGASRSLFERWCGDARNTVLIAGYSVAGTLGYDIKDQPTSVPAMDGRTLPRRIQIEEVSFAAHVYYDENADFIKQVGAKHVVLVHGQQEQMERFKSKFDREIEEDEKYSPVLYKPENIKPQHFWFRGEKMAKVVGKLAKEPPQDKQQVAGLVIKRNYNYLLVSPDELADHTEGKLKESVVKQRLVIAYIHGLRLLEHHLRLVHGHTMQVISCSGNSATSSSSSGGRGRDSSSGSGSSSSGPSPVITVRGIQLTLDESAGSLLLEWEANAENDMWADSIVATVLQVASSPATIKISEAEGLADKEAARVTETAMQKQLCQHLETVFGRCVLAEDGGLLTVTVDANEAIVQLPSYKATCAGNPVLGKTVQQATRAFVTTLRNQFRAAGGSGSGDSNGGSGGRGGSGSGGGSSSSGLADSEEKKAETA